MTAYIGSKYMDVDHQIEKFDQTVYGELELCFSARKVVMPCNIHILLNVKLKQVITNANS